jgi:hypothetical protein
MTASLTRDEVVRALTDGFLPLTDPDDLPARDRRVGLRELGLPYESEPAITRHLAAFLARAGRREVDAVLFNGGFFTPPLARARVLDVLESWFGARPVELEPERPETAVAVGAAFYGRLRHDPEAAKRLLIRAGSARAYYVGVQAPPAGSAGPVAVSVMPRGTQEGTSIPVDREFSVVTNEPLAFTLYSSTQRSDPAGTVVSFTDDEVHRHAPLVTAFRFGKRSRRVPLGVRLSATFTETGTLELWCDSTSTDHRWRLSFNLRGAEADPLEDAADDEEPDASQVLIEERRLHEAALLIRGVFGNDAAASPPETLAGELENALGHGKQAWPLADVRRLADVLLETAAGRRRAPACEIRWLNLVGFCTRPGFGHSLDEWRVSELRRIYASGLAFPKDIQCQVEWLVLWQRVGAGFSSGQQRELAQRVSGQLGIGQRKRPRLNPQIEREGWRLLGSLERLDPAVRTKLGDEMVERVRREPRHGAWSWTLSRLGGRIPLYGPLSSVVPPVIAARWIERLLAGKTITPDVANAVVQLGALTGDAARDISDDLRQRAVGALLDAGIDRDAVAPLLEVVSKSPADTVRAFGESLPEGLRLDPALPVA